MGDHASVLLKPFTKDDLAAKIGRHAIQHARNV
jgi:hypothetical protein